MRTDRFTEIVVPVACPTCSTDCDLEPDGRRAFCPVCSHVFVVTAGAVTEDDGDHHRRPPYRKDVDG